MTREQPFYILVKRTLKFSCWNVRRRKYYCVKPLVITAVQYYANTITYLFSSLYYMHTWEESAYNTTSFFHPFSYFFLLRYSTWNIITAGSTESKYFKNKYVLQFYYPFVTLLFVSSLILLDFHNRYTPNLFLLLVLFVFKVQLYSHKIAYKVILYFMPFMPFNSMWNGTYL